MSDRHLSVRKAASNSRFYIKGRNLMNDDKLDPFQQSVSTSLFKMHFLIRPYINFNIHTMPQEFGDMKIYY